MYTHLTDQPFRRSVAVATGEVTPGRLRGPEFSAVHRGVYLGSSVTVDVTTRARALALRAGDGAVIAGPLAALVLGADCPWDDAEVVVPGNRRLSHENALLRRCRLASGEVVTTGSGIVTTSPARTAFDLARRAAPLADRVAAVDALARAHGFDRPALEEIAARHPAVRGSVAAREVFGLVDPRAESLMETRMRLVVHFSDLPAPVPQLPVILPNGWRVRLDLGWDEQKVGVEYDGEQRSPARHADDVERDGGLQELRWRILRVTGRQVRRGPEAMLRRLGTLLAS